MQRSVETGKVVRDSVQKKLLGDPGYLGSGTIPREFIESTTPNSGIPEAVDKILVKHKSGGTSIMQFQSYDQGREAFQATGIPEKLQQAEEGLGGAAFEATGSPELAAIAFSLPTAALEALGLKGISIAKGS